MRRVSAKRRRRMRQVLPVRNAFRQANPFCQWPGCTRPGEVVHEITRGAARGAALDQPAALLHICHRHHDYTHNHPSVLRDLAAKKLANDGTYDLARVNALRSRSMVAIEEWEVDVYVGYFK